MPMLCSRTVTMVDSIPCSVGPASMISGILPSSSSSTCCAVVGLRRPNRFALGAASGPSNSRTISAKTGCALIRTATVSRPAVTISGTISRFCKTIVNGPGQNLSARFRTSCQSCTETSTIFSNQSRLGRCTMSGSKRGRSFASNIFATAIGFSASAASP